MESKDRELYIFKLNLADKICFSIMSTKYLPFFKIKVTDMCELQKTFIKKLY